tara:strand:- start:39391 stop:39729 length:339 start_codon:yes stop_codon:yes gene_type:complete
MAKKKSVNKSKAIRDYYAANPKAKPLEVAAALKKSGIDVTPAFVSTIRSTSKKKKVGKPGRPTGSKSSRQKTGTGADDVSFDSLIKVKSIVEQMGGVAQARAALDALEILLD